MKDGYTDLNKKINETITLIEDVSKGSKEEEVGKGFAVVAQEVRNLASRSAEAAKGIKNIVEIATSKANEGKSIANSMKDGYTDLNKKIYETIVTGKQIGRAHV